MSSLSIPRVFRRNKDGRDQVVETSQVVNVQDSKIRHILGITDAELKSARRQSVSSTSTTRLHSVSFSEATTVPVSTNLDNDQTAGRDLPHLRTRPSSVLLREDDRKLLSATSAAQLKSHDSNSTLQSYYDSQRAPLSISQQTSDSSSRDFALRKGSASVISSKSRDMEHTRQLSFFKTSRTKQKDRRKINHPGDTVSPDNQDKCTGNLPRSSKSPLTTLASISSTFINSPSLAPGRQLFSQQSPAGKQKTMTAFASPVSDTPFAKINVRRPKVGARHWFDDLEGYTSGEESHEEPELEQNFAVEVQRAFADGDFNANGIANRAQPTFPQSSPQPNIDTMRRRPEPCRVIIPHSHKMLETLPYKECRGQQLAAMSSLKRTSACSPGQRNPLAAADLSKQSVLSLSSSDDEENDDVEKTGHGDIKEKEGFAQRPLSLRRDPSIRDSLALSTMDDTDIEIGLAHTIKTRYGTPLVRPPRIREGLTTSNKRLSSLSPVSQRPDSCNSSYQAATVSMKDISESDIITSFPPTPSENGSRRQSAQATQSVNLEHDAVVISTRLMQVTKQEEKLLAAMRSKRAAMLDADRENERKSTLRMLESGGERNILPNHKLRKTCNDSIKLGSRSSYGPNSPRMYAHHQSIGSDANGDRRDSGTTFQTSSTYSRRESQATFRSNLSDESHIPYSTYSQFSQRNTIPTSLRSFNQSRQTDSLARDTFLSVASDATGRHRDSHIVMLDGLDEILDREAIPSQLFMEKPFLGWERAGLTAAH